MQKNKSLRSTNRSKTRLRYHIVLVSKYRKNIFTEMSEEEVCKIIQSTVSQCRGVKLLACGVDKNHIHIVVDCPPYWSVSQIVSRIKQLSTFLFWEKYGEVLKQFYWKKKIVWSDGYYCDTVGKVSEDNILEYVKNQGD